MGYDFWRWATRVFSGLATVGCIIRPAGTNAIFAKAKPSEGEIQEAGNRLPVSRGKTALFRVNQT